MDISNDFDWENRTWDLIDVLFKNRDILIAHHIESFDYFMIHQLPKIIKEKDEKSEEKEGEENRAKPDKEGRNHLHDLDHSSCPV